MKILLTGAAGSVGYQTLQKAIAAGHDVTALDLDSRKTRRKLKRYRAQATIVYGSINDAVLIGQLVRDVEVVIHLAAVIPPLADRNPRLAEQVNVEGTNVIVKAIKDYNPSCFLIFSSSISVYGDRLQDHLISVDDPLVPSEGDEYAVTKIRAEELIREAGIRSTIFRFTAIMGHPATDPLMFNMPLDTQLEIASVRDTAEALVTATSKINELQGRTFNLGGGPHCRVIYREYLKRMFALYGLQYRYLEEDMFAKQNFHCGWYADSHELEEILHFQHDDLESYYAAVAQETNGVVRFFTKLFSRPIIRFLVRESEPYQAKKTNDTALLARFFGNNESEEHTLK